MPIPVYINNRDRLTPVRAMVEYLLGIDGAVPIIVDNDSTYPPLLDWYADAPCEVLRTGKNGGTLAVYGVLPKPAEFRARWGQDLFVLTDPDLDLSGVPVDVLYVLAEGLRRYPQRPKCGLSLEIDDLPESSPWREPVRKWEAKFWEKRLDDRYFAADVDTTFCMTRIGRSFGYTATRTDRPYTARHLPWYAGLDELSLEERYYLEHARPRWTFWTARMKEALSRTCPR